MNHFVDSKVIFRASFTAINPPTKKTLFFLALRLISTVYESACQNKKCFNFCLL
jgi:hypothetical protein